MQRGFLLQHNHAFDVRCRSIDWQELPVRWDNALPARRPQLSLHPIELDKWIPTAKAGARRCNRFKSRTRTISSRRSIPRPKDTRNLLVGAHRSTRPTNPHFVIYRSFFTDTLIPARIWYTSSTRQCLNSRNGKLVIPEAATTRRKSRGQLSTGGNLANAPARAIYQWTVPSIDYQFINRFICNIYSHRKFLKPTYAVAWHSIQLSNNPSPDRPSTPAGVWLSALRIQGRVNHEQSRLPARGEGTRGPRDKGRGVSRLDRSETRQRDQIAPNMYRPREPPSCRAAADQLSPPTPTNVEEGCTHRLSAPSLFAARACRCVCIGSRLRDVIVTVEARSKVQANERSRRRVR